MSTDGEPGTRARWLGALLILVALAAVVWQAWVAGQGEDWLPTVPVAPVGRPSLGEMLASADRAKLVMQAASAAAVAASAASAVMAPDEAEVCGLGGVKVDESGQPKDMAPIQRAAQAARERVLPVLLGSPDEVTRAAGLLLQSAAATPSSGDAVNSARGVARDALANMAMATRSPQVYAWAMRACQGRQGEGMCQLLKAEQWARLDPDNAIPWLHVASDARSRHDEQAVSEALFRVSRAALSDARWGSLVAATIAKMPADLSLLSRGALAFEVLAIDAGSEMPLLAASQHCGAADVRDANRAQTCLAVADVLGGKGSTLLEVSLGAAIGARAGWPAERVAAGREERDALLQLSGQSLPQGWWSCVGIAKSLRDLAEIGQRGEMTAMRNTLKQSSEGVGVLARRHREAQAKEPAAAASEPASSPS